MSLLSHEEGWVRSAVRQLQKDNACGRDQAQKIMHELVDAGYAEFVQNRGKDGQFRYGYLIHAVRAQPAGSTASTRRSPGTGFPVPGSPFKEVEPRTTEPNKDLSDESVATGKRMGKPNPVFDALAELHGGTKNLSRPMAKTVGVATAAVRRATPNVNAGEIARRARNYRYLSWNDDHRPASAQALAKWWADCDTDPPVDARYEPSPPLTEEDWQRAIEESEALRAGWND